MEKIKKLAVIIISDSTAQKVETAVHETRKHYSDICENWEFIAICTDSAGGMPESAEPLQNEYPPLITIPVTTNLSLSAAISDAVRAVHSDTILLTDIFGLHDVKEVVSLFDELTDAEMVVGYRESEGGTTPLSWLAKYRNHLYKKGLGVRARDVDCPFKLIRTEVLKTLTFTAGNVLLHAELLARAGKIGARIMQVPVRLRQERKNSLFEEVRDLYLVYRGIAALRREIAEWKAVN